MNKKVKLTLISFFIVLLALVLFYGCDKGKQTEVIGANINSSVFKIEGQSLYTKVSNDTDSFSFSDTIDVADNATYTVSTDKEGKDIIRSKTVDLFVGDNTYYIIVENGNDSALYSVIVRRKQMYTVAFYADKKVVCYQEVEEDANASAPTAAVDIQGYEFNGWDFDFSTPITGATYVFAKLDRIITYSVEYDLNDEDLIYKADNPNKLTECTIKDLPDAPLAKGYLFKGWEREYNDKDKTARFTAKWEPIKYSIFYDFNDGNSMSKVENKDDFPDYYTVESSIVFSTPMRSGYSFKEWNIPKIEKGTCGEKTVLAIWDLINYSIEYNLNGCTNYSDAPNSFTVEDLPIVLSNAIPPDGYFKGWSYSASEGKYIAKIDSVGDKVLYAIFGGTDGIQYELSYDETYYSVSSYTGKSKEVVILNFYNDKPVKTIQHGAFKLNNNISKITIPSNVTTIEGGIFADYTHLTGVYITDFSKWCGISFGTNIMSIASNLYVNGEIPCGDFIIPFGTTKIPSGTFKNCAKLTGINIPDTVTSIGTDAFLNCSALANITSTAEIVSIVANQANPVSFDAIITSGTSITESLFYKLTGLKSVTIDNVLSIESKAFDGCTGLTSVTFGENVNKISEKAFLDCTRIADIQVARGNAKYHSDGNNLIDTDNKSIVLGCQNSIIPTNGSVVSIDDYAFYHCRNLKSILIPEGIVRIGRSAFDGCVLVDNFEIPDSVINIGASAFWGTAWYNNQADGIMYAGKVVYRFIGSMPQDTNIVLEDGVTGIADGAFAGCKELEGIKIPDSVKRIGAGAFRNCSSLRSISLPFVGESENADKGYNQVLGYIFGYELCKRSSEKVDRATLQYYRYGEGYYWYYIPSCLYTIKLGSGVSNIFKNAFSGTSLINLTISNSVHKIGEKAFINCKYLSSIHYDGTIEQWNSVLKDLSWDRNTGDYTVYCLDGNVVKQSN